MVLLWKGLEHCGGQNQNLRVSGSPQDLSSRCPWSSWGRGVPSSLPPLQGQLFPAHLFLLHQSFCLPHSLLSVFLKFASQLLLSHSAVPVSRTLMNLCGLHTTAQAHSTSSVLRPKIAVFPFNCHKEERCSARLRFFIPLPTTGPEPAV